MTTGLLLLSASAVELFARAELFAEHAATAGLRLGISALAVGILLAGAEPEELITAVTASSRDRPGIAVGDAIGANVTMLTWRWEWPPWASTACPTSIRCRASAKYIEVCRMVWRREPVVYDGQTVQIPLPAGRGTGLGKPLRLINHPLRVDIPVFWASLMGKSVTNTARHATGWLPTLFDPERFGTVWGEDLRAGLADRDPTLGPLQISAGGMVAIGDEYGGDGADRVLDTARPGVALYSAGFSIVASVSR